MITFDYDGCPVAWTRLALQRQYARVILSQAKLSQLPPDNESRRDDHALYGSTGNTDEDPTNFFDEDPVHQFDNFFRQRPGLCRLVGTKILKFAEVDAQSRKLRSDHPEILKFKRKQFWDSFKIEEHIDKPSWEDEEYRISSFACTLITALSGAPLAIILGIAACLVTALGLDHGIRGVRGAADGLQSCMTDLGLGYFCSNNSYQCGGSPSLSSTNTTFVNIKP